MPFIHIQSLPFEEPRNISEIILVITRDFSRKTAIDLKHIHTSWAFFEPGHYAKGENAPKTQPQTHHPILVDLLTPDFNDLETIATMLETIADGISQHASFPRKNIFINHRQAHSRMVFDDGKLVAW